MRSISIDERSLHRAIHNQLYSESLRRAIHFQDDIATLDVALCHGYGLGTTVNRNQCENWMKKAAARGSEAAVVFLKTMNPQVQEIELENDSPSIVPINELLIRICRQRLEENHLDEVHRILQFLLYTVMSDLTVSSNEDLVRILVEQFGSDLKIPVSGARGLLVQSMSAENRALFDFFLDQGVDPNEPFGNEYPLSVAAILFHHDEYYFRELLKRGARLTVDDRGKRTVTELVKHPTAASLISTLIERFPHLLTADGTGWHVLNTACLVGFSLTVAAILESGKNLFTNSRQGNRILSTAMSLAANSRRSESIAILETLLSFDQSISLPEPMSRLMTALNLACTNGNIQAAACLLQAGADPNHDWFIEPKWTSPLLAIHSRRLQFSDNVDIQGTARHRFEELKFQLMRRLLLQHGLDETRRYGSNRETAEDYCRSHWDGIN
jgi:hypothetical protein